MTRGKDVLRRHAKLTSVIHEISLMASRIFNRRVRDMGLTRQQWHVLYTLYYEHDGQTQSVLAEHLIMAKAPLGRIIDLLEQDAWVARRNDPTDRRTKRVYLTHKIEKLIGPLEGIVDKIGDITTAGFSKAELKQFNELTRRAHQNLSGEADARHD